MPLRFQVPGAAWTLEFSVGALAMLRQNAQRRWWNREAVGQLFSPDLREDIVVVETATRLRPVWSSSTGVRFDPRQAEAERAALFSLGLHCIGLWHTHPEPIPEPSFADLQLASEHACAARPALVGLVFVIVGTSCPPDGMRVSVHDGRCEWKARPVKPQKPNDWQQ